MQICTYTHVPAWKRCAGADSSKYMYKRARTYIIHTHKQKNKHTPVPS